MKALCSLMLVVSVLSVQNLNATQIHPDPCLETVTSEVIAVYPAVASTDNPYGQNYSIGIEIHGRKASWGNSITKVVCEGRSVSYRAEFGSDNKYSFSYRSHPYYFYF